MNFYLEILNDCDKFYFDQSDQNTNAIIDLSLFNQKKDLINFIQASLQKNTYVIIAKNSEVLISDLNILKANHFKVEVGKFVFLNFTLKKKINSLPVDQVLINNYQDVEYYLQQNLSNVFNNT